MRLEAEPFSRVHEKGTIAVSADIAKTPPAHVRVVTLTTLDQRMTLLEKHDAESYATLRDLKNLVESNHLAVMHELGQLAKALMRRARK